MTNVSPVKKWNYFNMKLIWKTGTKRAVCLAVDRCEQFCAYQAQKSPVNIIFFSVNKKFGNNNTLLSSKSSINVVAKVNYFLPNEHNQETSSSISQLEKVFMDQIFTIKATIKSFKWWEEISIGKLSIDKKRSYFSWAY